MNSLLWQAGARFLTRHPWQLLLALLGVLLGVAVVVSVDLAKSSALQSFQRATEALFGRATHRITAPGGVPDSLYRDLRRAGFASLRPVLEGSVVLLESGRSLKLVGVDPLAELRFAPAWMDGKGEISAAIWRRLLLEPGAVLSDRKTGEALGLALDQGVDVRAGSERFSLQPVGWFESERRSLGLTLIADLATAQEILQASGHLTAIDVIASDPAEIQALKALLPTEVEWMTREAGSVSVQRMTEAFYTNLTALSLLSLLVGIFLIYNMIGFMTVQRRRLFGILRVLGVTRREIQAQVLWETAFLGVAGSLLGLAAGIFLGRLMLALLARTLNDVYFPLPNAELTLSPGLLAKGFLLGVGATLAAAWKSAAEASRVQPVTVLSRSLQESRSRRRVWGVALGGLILLMSGWGLLRFSDSLVGSLLALTAMVLGCAFLVPLMTWGFCALLQPVGSCLFGVAGRMPIRSVVASLSRTGVAAAALMVAIAATLGMTLMIQSFRDSVASWLEQRLDADLYVHRPSSGHRSPLPDELGDSIAALPGVADVGSVRYLRQTTDQGFLRINAYDLSPSAFATFELVETAGADPWPAFHSHQGIMVSEAFANLNGIHAGESLFLPTARGVRQFPVIAVYEDYNAGRGIVAMSRATYDRFWGDPGVSTYWVYLTSEADVDFVDRRIRALNPGTDLEILDNRALLRMSMEIFDQAFAVTAVLRWLATVVAFVGVFSALLALQLERTPELGVFRALGLTPVQLWVQILAETGLLAGIAGVLACPTGILIGGLLTEVINRRAFGWTLSLNLNWEPLFQGVFLALLAGLLAGLYPAWKMARTHPAEALRCE
ncbi:MAG: FtsX-like permease family protein [Methylohalobius sp. ZOD2]